MHEGISIAFGDEPFRVDFERLTGRHVVVYGQTELTRDLYEARMAAGGEIIHEAENVVILDADSEAPRISFTIAGETRWIDCDFVAGCDGFHGVSRRTIPPSLRKEYEKAYPFGWLGVLSETPPAAQELIYSGSPRGFALCSMRNEKLSRYYVQCSLEDRPEHWSDQQFWDELRRRLPDEIAADLATGPSIEKSIAPLRSFVCEPMRWGRLFLCGDAAHIVPPTGAKGLNTAASDVHYLYHALLQHYEEGDRGGIERYSETALARVWKAERFSWWMTNLLHRFPDRSAFDEAVQRAELEFLREDDAAQTVLARNYVGLPY